MLKRLIFWSLLLSTLAACKYSRYVPEERYLLWKSEIEIKDGGRADALAEGVIRQKSNRKLLFQSLRPGLAIHSWGNGETENFWSKLGKEPIIFDASQSKRSAELLQRHYFNKGYFQVQVDTSMLYNKSRKRAEVRYTVKRGPRYRIDTISYDILENLEALGIAKSKDSKIKEGDYYDLNDLDAERSRLQKFFLNQGFYNFSESYIVFDADTNYASGEHRVHLKMIIRGIPKRQGDSIVYNAFKPYYIRDIKVVPDFSFQTSPTNQDSLTFLAYQLKFQDLNYKPRYLTDAIHFEKGDLYRQTKISETYSHYSGYKAFKVTEMVYTPVEGDSGKSYLDVEIRLVPEDKRSFNAELEVTNTSGNYGISGSVGIINRNLFKGGEALSFKINSGLEYQPTIAQSENLSRTFELGAEIRIDVPRFLLPFNTVGLFRKRMQTRSSVSIYANRTARVEFDRETFGGSLSYNWKESPYKSHQVDLLNISYSNLFAIDTTFIRQLDPIQILAFSSEFISSSSWRYTYTGQESVSQTFYDFFSTNLEIGGTLQSLLTNSIGEINEDDVSTLWGAPAYQFARLELDYRYYIHPSKDQLYAFRLNSSYILPYGKSRFEREGELLRLPPFSRFSFLGGTNDLRAWPAYRAGGGIERVSSYADSSSNFSIGTLKLLFNLEYRFPIYSSLKGAVFVDAGNIWLTGGLESAESAFALRNLARDLYIGSGFGLRMDLDFFVIRLDTGLRLRDPGYWQAGEEWVISTKPVLPNLTYNIALGYPF